MKTISRSLMVLIILISNICFIGFGSANLQAATPAAKPKMKVEKGDPKPSIVPGRIIIRLKDTAASVVLQSTNTGVKVTASSSVANINSLDKLNKKFKVKGARQLFRTDKDDKELVKQQGFVSAFAMKKQAGEKVIAIQKKYAKRTQRAKRMAGKAVELPTNVYVLQMDEKSNLQAALKEYRKDPNVVYAQPDYLVKVNSLPNDPLYPRLWGLQRIGVDRALDQSQGEGVVVAVVDTGLDYNHPDIRDNILTNTGEIPNNGIDDDANGFIDDVCGWSFVTGDNNTMDGHGHGSHVAGTIAAVGNNGIGVIGVAPRAKIMPLKGLGDDGSGASSDLANAIIYAAANGADIINNSWGCSGACPSNPLAEDAVRAAYGLGAVVVFAAGNSNMDVRQVSPQNMEEVITVGSVGRQDRRSSFSNFGSKIDVVAPGEDIISLNAQGGNNAIARENPDAIVEQDYLNISGTSMAAPHVAGEAALIVSQHPAWTIEQVKAAIRQSAEDIVARGTDRQTGRGLINAAVAVNVQTPRSLRINNPGAGQTLRQGERVGVLATIDAPDIIRYTLQYAPINGFDNAITIADDMVSKPLINEQIATWDTTGLAGDQYYLRLKAFLSSGAVVEEIITVRFSNASIVKLGDVSPSVNDTFEFIRNSIGIEGDNIVWATNGNIFLRRLSERTITQITDDELTSCGVDIENGKIWGWQQCNLTSEALSSRFFIHELSTGAGRFMPYRIGAEGFNLKDNKIYSGTHIYDIAQNSYIELPIHTFDLKSGVADNVVFSGFANNRFEVFLFNHRTEVSTSLSDHASYPKIAGRNVIWASHEDGIKERLILRNLDIEETTVLGNIRDYSNGAFQYFFKTDITSNKITWVEDSDGDSRIWLYDIPTGIISSIIPPEDVEQIRLAGNKLFWIGNAGVYSYDFPAPVPKHAVHISGGPNSWGGTFVSTPAGINCSTTGYPSACGAEFEQGTEVTITPQETSNSQFRYWDYFYYGVQRPIPCTNTDLQNKCTFIVNGPVNDLRGYFGPFTSTATGTLRNAQTNEAVNPPSLSFRNTARGIDASATVSGGSYTLDANRFTVGTYTVVAPGYQNQTVTFNKSESVAGVWTKDLSLIPIRRVVRISGAANSFPGTFVSTPAGINCSITGDPGVCQAEFDQGAEVTITAEEGSNSVFQYLEYNNSGAIGRIPCTNVDGKNRCTFTLADRPVNLSGYFTQYGATVTGTLRNAQTNELINPTSLILRSAEGVDVRTTVSGGSYTTIDPAFLGTYTVIAAGYQNQTVSFKEDVSGVRIRNLNLRPTVRYGVGISSALNSYPGTLVSTPAGINCSITGGGPGACQAVFDQGTEVTITAQEGSNYVFQYLEYNFLGNVGRIPCVNVNGENRCTFTVDFNTVDLRGYFGPFTSTATGSLRNAQTNAVINPTSLVFRHARGFDVTAMISGGVYRTPNHLESGNYTVIAAGYQNQTVTFNRAESVAGVWTKNLSLTPVAPALATISGRVLALNGQPVAGRTVTLSRLGAISKSAVTNAQGYYQITQVTPGMYTAMIPIENRGRWFYRFWSTRSQLVTVGSGNITL